MVFKDSGLQHSPAGPWTDRYVQLKSLKTFPMPMKAGAQQSSHRPCSLPPHGTAIIGCLSFTHTHPLWNPQGILQGQKLSPTHFYVLGLSTELNIQQAVNNFSERIHKSHSWNVLQITVTESYCHGFLAKRGEGVSSKENINFCYQVWLEL